MYISKQEFSTQLLESTFSNKEREDFYIYLLSIFLVKYSKISLI